MIANCKVDIIAGAATEDGWGDTVITEFLAATVPGHIGNDIAVSGKDQTDASGVTVSRCRIRLPGSVAVPPDSVLRIDGVRWKPVHVKVARSLQHWSIYDCQRLD